MEGVDEERSDERTEGGGLKKLSSKCYLISKITLPHKIHSNSRSSHKTQGPIVMLIHDYLKIFLPLLQKPKKNNPVINKVFYD